MTSVLRALVGDAVRDLCRTRSYRAWRREVVGVSGTVEALLPFCFAGVDGSKAVLFFCETGVWGTPGWSPRSWREGVFGNESEFLGIPGDEIEDEVFGEPDANERVRAEILVDVVRSGRLARGIGGTEDPLD